MIDETGSEQVNDLPTISCSRCNAEWDLRYELEVLRAGNQSIEQFALDHERHTGHFPDDLTPWIAQCQRCPDGTQFLAERPARRWAVTHARHTRHSVELSDPDGEDIEITPKDSEP